MSSDFFFDHFSLFFPFDSLGAVTKISCPVLCYLVRFVGPICRGTTVRHHRGEHRHQLRDQQRKTVRWLVRQQDGGVV